jgi:hypothetical protein
VLCEGRVINQCPLYAWFLGRTQRTIHWLHPVSPQLQTRPILEDPLHSTLNPSFPARGALTGTLVQRLVMEVNNLISQVFFGIKM